MEFFCIRRWTGMLFVFMLLQPEISYADVFDEFYIRLTTLPATLPSGLPCSM